MQLVERMKSGSMRRLRQRTGLIDLTSNDYLGLSRNTAFQRATMKKWEEWSTVLCQKNGSTGSRLLTGNHRFFEETEAQIAAFHGYPSATLFNCGYMANQSILTALFTKEDTLLVDLEAHASLHGGSQVLYFRHNDLNHLEKRLKAHTRCGVIVESLYSMSGDLAPISEIAALCEKYGAKLVVDESHALGVLGPKGRGLACEGVYACMGAFGKGLGAHGAAVLGSNCVKKTLLNFARPLIYSTALPLSTLAAIACSYERFPSMDVERHRIETLCRRFHFHSHLHPIHIGDIARAQLASLFLAHRGFDVRAIVSPTVPRGKERLRLNIHAFNTEEEIDDLLRMICKWM